MVESNYSPMTYRAQALIADIYSGVSKRELFLYKGPNSYVASGKAYTRNNSVNKRDWLKLRYSPPHVYFSVSFAQEDYAIVHQQALLKALENLGIISIGDAPLDEEAVGGRTKDSLSLLSSAIDGSLKGRIVLYSVHTGEAEDDPGKFRAFSPIVTLNMLGDYDTPIPSVELVSVLCDLGVITCCTGDGALDMYSSKYRRVAVIPTYITPLGKNIQDKRVGTRVLHTAVPCRGVDEAEGF